jgi:hypothetical protein
MDREDGGEVQGGKKRRTERYSLGGYLSLIEPDPLVANSRTWPVPALAEQLHKL